MRSSFRWYENVLRHQADLTDRRPEEHEVEHLFLEVDSRGNETVIRRVDFGLNDVIDETADTLKLAYDDILDHCCYAWNALIDQPWKIMSIGTRDWAHGC